jgi:hypothetical protein
MLTLWCVGYVTLAPACSCPPHPSPPPPGAPLSVAAERWTYSEMAPPSSALRSHTKTCRRSARLGRRTLRRRAGGAEKLHFEFNAAETEWRIIQSVCCWRSIPGQGKSKQILLSPGSRCYPGHRRRNRGVSAFSRCCRLLLSLP